VKRRKRRRRRNERENILIFLTLDLTRQSLNMLKYIDVNKG